MIIAVLFCIIIGLFILLADITNRIRIVISLYLSAICILMLCVLLYTAKFSYYNFSFKYDYSLYLLLSKIKITMTAVSQISNIGLVLMLISFVIIPLLYSQNKFKYLLIIPIIFFGITNSATFSYDAYFRIHTASLEHSFFLNRLYMYISTCNISIFYTYMFLPIIFLVRNYKKTKIFFFKQDSLISIVCLSLLNFFVLSTFTFGIYKPLMFYNMNYHKFPEKLDFAEYSSFSPIILVLLVLVIVMLVTCKKPFSSLSIISKKQLIRNNKQLNKNISMILHSEKNQFFLINRLAKEALNDDSCATSKLNIIANISNDSMTKLSKILDLIKERKLTFQKANLIDCINRALYSVIPDDRTINISTSYLRDDKLMIDMDTSHLSEVFLNIFKNSYEALKKRGNSNPTINISICTSEGFAIIDITDNGCGIDKKNLKQIFMPFFSTKSNSTNWGMGLNYVYKAIRLHKGKIKVNSRLNQYTNMQIVLPISHERKGGLLWK